MRLKYVNKWVFFFLYFKAFFWNATKHLKIFPFWKIFSLKNILHSKNILWYLLYQLFCRGIFYHICCIGCSVMASFIIFFVLVVLQWHYLPFSLRYLVCNSTPPALSAYWKHLACTQSNLWHNPIGIIGLSQLPNLLLHGAEHSRTDLGPLMQKGPQQYLFIGFEF